MREPGVEPGRLAALDPKSSASANSATLAESLCDYEVCGGHTESSRAEAPPVFRYRRVAETRLGLVPGRGATCTVARSRQNCDFLPRSRSRRLVRVDAAQAGSGVGLAGFRTHANRLADFHGAGLATGGRLAARRFGSAGDGSIARPGLAQPVASRWWHVPALAADRAR